MSRYKSLPPDLPGKVYVMRAGERGPVKIGFTSRGVRKRRRALQTGHHDELVIVWSGPGTPADEAAIHRLLAPSRMTGEWFAPTHIVRIALGLLQAYGAPWVADLDTDMLTTFVPTVPLGVPLFHRIRPLREWGTGGYWPQWTTTPGLAG